MSPYKYTRSLRRTPREHLELLGNAAAEGLGDPLQIKLAKKMMAWIGVARSTGFYISLHLVGNHDEELVVVNEASRGFRDEGRPPFAGGDGPNDEVLVFEQARWRSVTSLRLQS